MTENPELLGAKSLSEYYEKLVKAHGLEEGNEMARIIAKKNWKELGRDSGSVFEGHVPAEFLKGENYKAQTMEELMEYIKRNPKRFAKGVGMTGAGVGHCWQAQA